MLKELYELYKRLDANEKVKVARWGWSLQKISFRVILTHDGKLVEIRDSRGSSPVKKKTKNGLSVSMKQVKVDELVLGSSKPSGSGVNPCFLWDNPAYLLGHTGVKPRALDYFEEFKKRHLQYEKEINSDRFSAVCRFLESWDPKDCVELFPVDKDCLTGNGVFEIQGDFKAVHEDPAIVDWWEKKGYQCWSGGKVETDVESSGICLITGEKSTLARLHEPAIRGVVGAQATGAKLVSFNCASFESYGKEQGLNAPVSERAAFAYCSALNYLLGEALTRVRLPGTTVVFWTDSPPGQVDEDECLVQFGLDPSLPPPALDEGLVERVKTRLKDIASGKNISDYLESVGKTQFFILGLSPNSSRLSVRFFYKSYLGDFIRNLQSHYAALDLPKRSEKFKDPEVISPYMILKETARDVDDIPPLFAGALMRSILQGIPYPDSMAQAIIRRFHADHYISRTRCAFLKAWLTRKNPSLNLQPMLDTYNTQSGYVLGRLFAILVKTQKDALGEINCTIQDSYYSSASATPQSVFPRLLRLYRHHLIKLSPEGVRINREKLVQEVMSLLSAFPARLTLEQQGLFALGFYHQTQSLFIPNTKTTKE